MYRCLFERVEVAETVRAVANQESAAHLLIRQRSEAFATVLDAAAFGGVLRGRPVDLRERHAMELNSLRRRLIEELLRIRDLAGAHRERPVVAGAIARARRRIEYEVDAIDERLRAARVRKAGDELDA